jgi:Transposase
MLGLANASRTSRSPLPCGRRRYGATVDEVCRKMGVSEPTLCRRKTQFVDMGVPEIRRLKRLEDENSKLKRLAAERFEAARDGLADGLQIAPGLAGDGGDRQTLAV